MKNSPPMTKTRARNRWNLLVRAIKSTSSSSSSTSCSSSVTSSPPASSSCTGDEEFLWENSSSNQRQNNHHPSSNNVGKKRHFEVFAVQPVFAATAELSSTPVANLDEESTFWYTYTLSDCCGHDDDVEDQDRRVHILVRLPTCHFTMDSLIGFDNTGNVRIWPSEEILAHEMLKYGRLFEGKNVLEIGGGMSCLAGICVASRANCRAVHLTDGNPNCVQNVEKIVEKNEAIGTFKKFEEDGRRRRSITCGLLVWEKYTEHGQQYGAYDVILAADCLFFDDQSRKHLCGLIDGLLQLDGVAMIMSPRRGASLGNFVEDVRRRGLKCSVFDKYDQKIWQRRRHKVVTTQQQHLADPDDDDDDDAFVDDAHYPLLMVVQKEGPSQWLHLMKTLNAELKEVVEDDDDDVV